jgi:hypothetical protein
VAAGRVVDHLEIHRFDRRVHGRFVFGTFQSSLRRPVHDLIAALAQPGRLVLVATPVGDPELVGWLAARPTENRIICAYTKAIYRASPEQRHGVPGEPGENPERDAFRIASSLALEAGIDFGRTVLCSFWSRHARKIRAKPGNPYRLRFAPEASVGVLVLDDDQAEAGH